MVREDLVSSLRNAVERGESLEKAKISLTNAGYDPAEVEQAAAALAEEVEERLPIITERAIGPKAFTGKARPSNLLEEEKPKKKADTLTIVLIAVFAVLLVAVGIILVLSFIK
jgi:hypothetical protein